MILMFMNFRESYFSLNGRLGRFAFFKKSTYLGIITFIFAISCIPLFSSGRELLWWFALAVLVCIGAASFCAVASLTVRRLHDLKLSGYHAIWVICAQLLWIPISKGPPLAIILGLPLFGIGLWIMLWPGQTKDVVGLNVEASLPSPLPSSTTRNADKERPDESESTKRAPSKSERKMAARLGVVVYWVMSILADLQQLRRGYLG
jgi:uncharacterized membrane protein YhaH (DUF805 family)